MLVVCAVARDDSCVHLEVASASDPAAVPNATVVAYHKLIEAQGSLVQDAGTTLVQTKRASPLNRKCFEDDVRTDSNVDDAVGGEARWSVRANNDRRTSSIDRHSIRTSDLE